MLHFIFLISAIAAGSAAYADGMIPMGVAVIGLFFAAYALCMGVLFHD